MLMDAAQLTYLLENNYYIHTMEQMSLVVNITRKRGKA